MPSLKNISNEEVADVSLYKLSCTKCDLVFDRILLSSDLSAVHCAKCNSTEIVRVVPDHVEDIMSHSKPVPTGALSGPSCSSGFS